MLISTLDWDDGSPFSAFAIDSGLLGEGGLNCCRSAVWLALGKKGGGLGWRLGLGKKSCAGVLVSEPSDTGFGAAAMEAA
jgi:hypothetical protein